MERTIVIYHNDDALPADRAGDVVTTGLELRDMTGEIPRTIKDSLVLELENLRIYVIPRR
jgi:hypothetical protein